ncbi:MAG: hypothetical protein CME64_01655 [Halobacteriovoraceae bacterium]|nr:hypothetical protein [Halobacteriovoraceae bacterium]|tara:strand:- start:91800 stop:92654 length:855 start_codon:yes stop_codon:yes gene_type:complete
MEFLIYIQLLAFNFVVIDLMMRIIVLIIAFIVLLVINSFIASVLEFCFVKKDKFHKLDYEDFDIEEFKEYLDQNPMYLRQDTNWFTKRCNPIFAKWPFLNNTNELNMKNFTKCFVIIFNITFLYFVLNTFTSDISSAYEATLESLNKTWFYIVGAFIAMFWHRDAVFQRKWKHCHEILLELNKCYLNSYLCSENDLLDDEDKDSNIAKYENTLINNFLLDTLHLDLWAHKSYFRAFNNFFIELIEKDTKFEAIEIEKIMYKISKREMSPTDMEKIIRFNERPKS